MAPESSMWRRQLCKPFAQGPPFCFETSEVPSDIKKPGQATACGRGVYTSKSFEMAMSYAINHILGEEGEWMELSVVKVILLVAIPGHSAPLQGRWGYCGEAKKGERYQITPVKGTLEKLQQTQQRGV